MPNQEDASKEHPITQILRQDRVKEDDQATATLKDYHTTVTYLGAGALGFFLTINEKFFPLGDGRYFYLFIISLSLLFLSLLLYVFSVLLDYYGSSRLRDMMDDDIQGIDFETATQAQIDAAERKLDAQWEKIELKSRILMLSRLTLVILGIGAEVVFMALNFSLTIKKDNPGTIQIQIPAHRAHTTITVDTTEKDNLHIQFLHP
jgi:hypothetical protein